MGQIISDDYATAWDALYPGSPGGCAEGRVRGVRASDARGVEARDRESPPVASKLRRIPGESERIPVELVTLRLTIAQPSVRVKSVFVHTFTAVAAGDRWSWILTPSKYELYRSNGCGV